ncbi:MAG TPA: hypothetical protein VKH15_16295 [Candidatus Acidoferrum sp.]|jgi:hypothetical protein|nr:hypothetical protein [Candidatus Acidoferrum sp.]
MSYVERRRFLWILFLGGLALLVLAVAASATTLSRLKFEDLALESTAVARLRCLGATSQWEQGEIWTETRFEVVQREKGTLPGIVTVRLLGGQVGHLHSHVDEVPAFRPGEEVYLFLWGNKSDSYQVLGWSQGTFRIARNPQSGLEMVTQDSAAASIFDPQARAFRHGGIRNLPVSIFREKLHKALRRENQ